MRLIGALIVFVALAGCSGCWHNPPPQASYPGWDGGAIDYTPPEGPATCLDVCRNGQHLGCTWAAPTPAGASCTDVCANNQSAGIAPWDIDCRAHATSCSKADVCR